ncbi:MAG: nucleotidyltransferase domain-containing protein [Candidatus Helarchaeota archaeon]
MEIKRFNPLDKKLMEQIYNILKNHYKITALILFGSRARNDHLPYSDYDILIIADFQENYLDRINNILNHLIYIKKNIEIYPYTLKEALLMLKNGNPTIFDALDEGITFFKNSEFTILEKLFQELKNKGMKRSKTSIILP